MKVQNIGQNEFEILIKHIKEGFKFDIYVLFKGKDLI